MQPADRIAPPSWITEGPGGVVATCLRDAGVMARFVGGPVRDAVLGRPVTDIDLACDAPPDRVRELAEEAGFKVVPTGIEHGTVTVIADHTPIEVTTLRRDVETDGRRAVVAFTDDWAEDAARRDFTMNALYLDPDGALYDPLGQGLADARAGAVRFVGDAALRIKEDALRILRLFRFQASHGRTDPDFGELAVIKEMAGLVEGLSGERVWHELSRLLAAPGAILSLRLMVDCGVLGRLLPNDEGITGDCLNRAVRLIELERELDLSPDPVRRLAALSGDSTDMVADRLRLSRVERLRLKSMLLEADSAPTSDHERRRQIYLSGSQAFVDRRLLEAARVAQTGDLNRDHAVASTWERPEFPLKGADIIALGVRAGPEVGEILKSVEAWWVDGDFTGDRSACLSAARERVGD